MRISRYTVVLLLFSLVFVACDSSKKIAKTVDEAVENAGEEVEVIELDEMEVFAPRDLGPYRASKTRFHDLLHTNLDVRFDWNQQHLLGKATLDLTPYFYATNKLTLDAKGFEIKEVALMKNGAKSPLSYTYDENAYINITLDKEYKAGEKYQIFVDYVAKPNDLEVVAGTAITDERGLYFINPLGEEEGKPKQIWTQGETEFNSCWFPTIDSPNEKSTQETAMTVASKYKTLSNGKFIGSTNNGDGTRTDRWKQDIHHAPYLFMMAVGEFEVIEDSWNGIPVNYYVEKEYAPYAQQIFGNTPEMMTFYSELLDYPYPWDKYHQIVVRDFVSGAMENTSAVIFYDGMNRDFRALLDEDGEDIIAHELFHHWFGDIVTCESWSNLPLNESFATYGEYLWMEYKYGKDEADHHIMMDMRAHFSSSRNDEGKRHMIRYYYDEKEDMFDTHSYQKGGRILHMLRNYVGDEAFFASLQKYLKDNEYQAVEMAQLRLAFEEVTGEDLNWFFNQWFFNVGHPILEIEHEYLEEGKVLVSVKQTQDEDPFELPVAIDIYTEDPMNVGRPQEKQVMRKNVVVSSREETFVFEVPSRPKLVNFDADKMLLCQKTENKTVEEYAYQLANSPNFLDRYEVPMNLREEQASALAQETILAALEDPYWSVRGRAIMTMDMEQEDLKNKAIPILKEMAKNDEESTVRYLAIEKLGELGDNSMLENFKSGIQDSSYQVVGKSLAALASIDEKAGLAAANKLKDQTNEDIIGGIARVYGQYGGKEELSWFNNNIEKMEGYARYLLAGEYSSLLAKVGDNASTKKGIEVLKDMAINDNTWWVRANGTSALVDLKGSIENVGLETDQPLLDLIQEALKMIKKEETNENLVQYYKRLIAD